MEAQYRWLRPAEISEILWNYQKFHIASEPPNRPSSMIIANYLEAIVVNNNSWSILACMVKIYNYTRN